MEGVYFVFSSEKWLTRPLSVIYSVSFFHSSPKFVDRVKNTLAKRVFSPHFSFASIRGSVCFSSVPGLTCVQQVCYFYQVESIFLFPGEALKQTILQTTKQRQCVFYSPFPSFK